MDAKVTWQAGLSFSGTAGTGFTVPLGSDPLAGGANDGFRPLELMAVGLAGCTAMDVISILEKKQQHISAFEVGVHTTQAQEHPKVFTQAVITYRITGQSVDEAAVLRAIELSEEKYCPSLAMLRKAVPFEFNYEVFETQGDQEAQLVKAGKYQPRNSGPAEGTAR
jgi:putative redox protein